MRLIFIGDPVEIERAEGLSRMSTNIYGVHFPMSAEVDVSHLPPKLQQKLVNNPHFRVVGIDAPAVPLIVPVAKAAVQSAESAASVEDDQAEAPAAGAPRPRRRIA